MRPLRSQRWPRGHLLNPATPYFNSSQTDVGRTMARAYAELERMKREGQDLHKVLRMKDRGK